MDMNNVVLNGRLGKDPEVRKLTSGSIVTTFSIANNEVFKNKAGEKIETVDWFDVEVWGRNAEVAEKYLKKGSQISLAGRLKTSSWEDKDGKKRSKFFIKASQFQMLGKASGTTEKEAFTVSIEDIAF
jgi:single-strand DNA-binding protein